MKAYTVWARMGALALVAMLGRGHAQPTPLKTLAQARGITIGAAITFPSSPSRMTFDSLVTRNFTGIVAENDQKFGSIEPSNGSFSWTNSDRIVDFAQQFGLKLRFHNFIWHQQSSFVANGTSGPAANSFTRDSAFQIMRRHINTVMQRYKTRNGGQMGVFTEWDIVNEATARDSGLGDTANIAGGMRMGSGDISLLSRWVTYTQGETHDFDYVDSAFAIAHRNDTTAKLVYNDYDAEGMGKKSNTVFSLVSKLKSRGIPVNAVGMQCHWHLGQAGTTSNGAWDAQEVVQNMARIAALGLDISITELDIRITTPSDSTKLAAQSQAYQTILGICLAQPRCKNFFVWGVRDDGSWIPGKYTGFTAPLLFSGSGTTYTPKPAYYGLIATLQSTAVRAEPGARRRAPALTFRAGEPLRDLMGRRIKSLPGRPADRPAFAAQRPVAGPARAASQGTPR